jgi:threonine/homoserine/homoserine lactone efflux protein
MMSWLPDLPAFAMVAILIVCSPGPNMIYLVSRSVSQGSRAGLLSLVGTAAAFVIYLLSAVLGISALLIATPYAYEMLRIAGAIYLLWLAWKTVRRGGASPLEIRNLAPEAPSKLITMGFLTNLLNPKAAVLYLSLLPQFIRPDRGHVIEQGLLLGATQIAISMTFNAAFIVGAGACSRALVRHPSWGTLQRWLMGSVLAGLAGRMLVEGRR